MHGGNRGGNRRFHFRKCWRRGYARRRWQGRLVLLELQNVYRQHSSDQKHGAHCAESPAEAGRWFYLNLLLEDGRRGWRLDILPDLEYPRHALQRFRSIRSLPLLYESSFHAIAERFDKQARAIRSCSRRRRGILRNGLCTLQAHHIAAVLRLRIADFS